MNKFSGHADGVIVPDEKTTVPSTGRRRSSRSNYGADFVFAVFLLLGLHIGMLLTRDPFMRIYQDFDVKLPLLTTVAMSFWTFLTVSAVLVITVGKEHVVKDKVIVLYWNLAVCLGAIIVICVYVVALIRPLQRLIITLT